jgi:hypothetical protein
MSDKDEAAAPVGYSETASVQDPPGAVHPEVGQVPEDGTEVVPVVDRQKARDVFADEPTGTELSQQSRDVHPQARAWVTHACTTAPIGVALAGPSGGDDGSFGNNTNCCEVISGHLREVFEQSRFGEPVGQDTAGSGVDLDGGEGGDAGAVETQIDAPDARAQRHQMQAMAGHLLALLVELVPALWVRR